MCSCIFIYGHCKILRWCTLRGFGYIEEIQWKKPPQHPQNTRTIPIDFTLTRPVGAEIFMRWDNCRLSEKAALKGETALASAPSRHYWPTTKMKISPLHHQQLIWLIWMQTSPKQDLAKLPHQSTPLSVILMDPWSGYWNKPQKILQKTHQTMTNKRIFRSIQPIHPGRVLALAPPALPPVALSQASADSRHPHSSIHWRLARDGGMVCV